MLLVDLGGGSCELTLSEHKHIKETVSLPLGAVRLTEQFLPTDPAPADGLARMRQLIARELRRAHRRIQPGRAPLVIATSGTAAALSDACALVPKTASPAARNPARLAAKSSAARAHAENRSAILAGMVPARAVRKLAGKLAKMPLPEREAVPGIGPRRAEIIVAGAQVYAEILETFGLPGFRYSPLGLRDGILAQMLAEQDARAKVHREFEHERWESVLATARRYGVDPHQAEPVRGHAVQLFRELRPVHQLPPEYESWLAAAAMLRDTGKFINHQGHHRHTQYIISSSEIYGYTQLQRTLVSAIARYMGKSRPQPGDRALRNIPSEEHKNVHRAVVLLRLAVAFNQDRASDVLRVGTRIYPKRVYLELRPGARARSWSCGRCARKLLTFVRSSGASSSSRWHRWPAPCADRGATAAAADAAPCPPARWTLPHADRGASVAGDQPAKELKQLGLCPTTRTPSRSAYFASIFWNSAKVASIPSAGLTSTVHHIPVPSHKLRRLPGALQRTRNDSVDRRLQRPQHPRHQHALLLAFLHETPLDVEHGVLANGSGIRVAHQVEDHGDRFGGGLLALPNSLRLILTDL